MSNRKKVEFRHKYLILNFTVFVSLSTRMSAFELGSYDLLGGAPEEELGAGDIFLV